jgi:hypothetical protein
VLANIDRIQRWKQKLGRDLPYLDSFFVVMRSNFREIPQYLDLMAAHGMTSVALQTVQINGENSGQFPLLGETEEIRSPGEIRELHALLAASLPRARQRFHRIRLSGLQSLFESQGLSCPFLQEGAQGLYPNSDELLPESEDADAEPSFDLCPNPWTTLFLAEDGGAHLCFLSEPIGNIYETPIVSLWNCGRALEKRSQMIAGQYLASGCSRQWCGWREGKTCAEPKPDDFRRLREELRVLTDRAIHWERSGNTSSAIAPVRRQLASRGRRIAELEALFGELCRQNGAIHERGQSYIDQLESHLQRLQDDDRMAHERGQRHIDHLESRLQSLQEEFDRFRGRRSVRAAVKVSDIWRKVMSRVAHPGSRE